jgi:hypothetical protein
LANAVIDGVTISVAASGFPVLIPGPKSSEKSR